MSIKLKQLIEEMIIQNLAEESDDIIKKINNASEDGLYNIIKNKDLKSHHLLAALHKAHKGHGMADASDLAMNINNHPNMDAKTWRKGFEDGNNLMKTHLVANDGNGFLSTKHLQSALDHGDEGVGEFVVDHPNATRTILRAIAKGSYRHLPGDAVDKAQDRLDDMRG